MALPMINGQMYSWADITINILGIPVTGVTSIEYADNQTIEPVYGAGRFPIGYGSGKIETTVKITLIMEEVEALTAAAPNRRLQDLPPFDIPVLYLPTDGILAQHKIRNCKVKNNNRKPKVDDTRVEVELELFASHIEW